MNTFVAAQLTTSTSPGPGSLAPDSLAQVRFLIDRQPWLFRTPAALVEQLRLKRRADFGRLAIIGMPLLLLLWTCDIAVGATVYGADLKGADRIMWYSHMNMCAGLLVLAFVMTRVRALLPGYLLWVSLLAGAVVYHKLYLSMVLEGHRLAQCSLDMTLMMLIIVMLAMRLTVVAATATCLGAGALACTLALAHGTRADMPHVTICYFGTIHVCFFVAILLDRQERLNFLQAVMLAHDGVELATLNRRLEHISQTDALSGLANRRHFNEVLAHEWERAQREGSSMAVVFVDVDHFKLYNDTYGHLAGDDCLSLVGRALASALRRPADLAARYGGEEFVILLPGTGTEGAQEVAERALAAVDALRIPHSASSVGSSVTISVGIAAMVPPRDTAPAVLIEAADTALYAAKQQGRHRVVVGA